MQFTDSYLEKIRALKKLSVRIKRVMLALSLVVIASVFWTLKLTGITMAGEAFCGIDEHAHNETCGQPPIICEMAETDGHYHTDSCISQHLICELLEIEGHAHNDGCYTATLMCTTEETDGHTHSQQCYDTQIICTLQEHQHSNECIVKETVCQTEENSEHTHTEECFVSTVICTQEEHVHIEQCKSENLVCQLAETEAHHHTDVCYQYRMICTAEETEGHSHTERCYEKDSNFICQPAEGEEHLHTAECLGGQAHLCCGSDVILPHTHTEECFGPAEECQMEEHIHTSECYSDVNADVETQMQWEETLPGVAPDARPQDNILAVAYSQLGYAESTKNYQLDRDGNKNGYNRYGQWYGNPYGQWNTMFVSFCLHYSQLAGIPLSAGAETLRLDWEATGLYIPAADIQPQPGDLIFLDTNENLSADTVAIITDYADGIISVIQGDFDNTVAQTEYFDTDIAIMGYGRIPHMGGIMTLEARDLSVVGKTVNFTGQNLNGQSFMLYTQSNGNYYAIDGNANAVQIYIDGAGNITADVSNINSLYWQFESASNYDNRPAYYIRNVATGTYIHPFNNDSANGGAILTGKWETALYQTNNGAKLRGARQNSYMQYWSNGTFNQVNNYNAGSVMYLARTPQQRTLWLDGTAGGLRVYGGSLNRSYTVYEGATFTLPTEWQVPTKYAQKLGGWYDITNSVYYPAGSQITITGDMVLYAYWEVDSYDIGEYNEHTVNTSSYGEFIKTKVFDYGYLFNLMSQNPQITVSSSEHSEKWSMVTSGNVRYKNAPTLDYMFLDWHGDQSLTLPGNRNDRNASNGVYEGLLTEQLRDILFSTENSFDPTTGEGIIGKKYLGEGDNLFQYASDPSHPYYGYYYYDSQLNAASYNQSAQRFYVYDYLAATSDSLGNESYSDFLPLNSPYANKVNSNVGTYTYDGINGEYRGTTHYRYEIGYSDGGNVMANMGFGTSVEVKFHLPKRPGEKDADGEYGNKDIHGNEMHFEFSGDDDLWVLIDDKLVLDLGGIHGVESGSVNFSTGVVTVNGTQHHVITDIPAGEHIMQIYYLERGSSQSNCSMRFNLAPRYSLNIQKEDVLTQHLLNGAEFAVYTDPECKHRADLWTSEASYMAGDPAAEKFTVVNGSTDIWGFSAGNTYYIKEVTPPSAKDYDLARGIIRFSIDKVGIATYGIEIINEVDESGNKIPVSNGYTVHGVNIDAQSQKAYIVVTNAQNWVKETTTVQAVKKWDDDKDHSNDYVTVYLTVTDPDGTVRRIREIVLSDENNWSYLWTGLPKYLADGLTPVNYGIDEAYEEGYYSSSMQVDRIEIDKSEWAEAVDLENNKVYLLGTSNGYLSTLSENDTIFKWVDEYTAKSSPLAQWTAVVNSDNQVKLTNRKGQTITFKTSGGMQYVADKSSGNNQTLTMESVNGGLRFYVSYNSGNDWWQNWHNYYIGAVNNSYNGAGSISSPTSSDSALVFVPMTLVSDIDVIEVKDLGFKITNTPLDEETSVTVNKVWKITGGYNVNYREELVTVRLLANGIDTGRTVTLTLKNNWRDTFRGLPYKDENGQVIKYTVEEVWRKQNWLVEYGEITTHSGNTPTYSTTVTNIYIVMGPALPSTGSFARLAYIYCGGGIMLASLIAAIRQRRKRERRKE